MPREASVGPSLAINGTAYRYARAMTNKVRICVDISDKHGSTAATLTRLSAQSGPAHAATTRAQRIVSDVELLRRAAIRLCVGLRAKAIASPLEMSIRAQASTAATGKRRRMSPVVSAAGDRTSANVRFGGGRYLTEAELAAGAARRSSLLPGTQGGTLSPPSPVLLLRLLSADLPSGSSISGSDGQRPKLGEKKPPRYVCPHR